MSPAASASASAIGRSSPLHSAGVNVGHHPMQHFYQLWQATLKPGHPPQCALLMPGLAAPDVQHVMAIRSLTAYGILLLGISNQCFRPVLQAGQQYQLLFHSRRYQQPLRILAGFKEVNLPAYRHPWQQQWCDASNAKGLLFDPLQLEMPHQLGQDETVKYVKSKRQWLMINS